MEIPFYKADMVGLLAPNALWAFAHGVVYRSLSADVLKDEDCGNCGLRELWRRVPLLVSFLSVLRSEI
jgi:hypothetical protein